MTRPVAIVVFIAALVVPWAVLLGTNAVMGEPPGGHLADRCTRHCHDHGCPHDPVLPDVLAGDDGLYGRTIDALWQAGRWTGLPANIGYGLANILVFCVAWPGLMAGLLAVGLVQRVRLRERRQRLRPRGRP